VRKSGNRVRITAQLIRAADGYHQWSQTYDRELDDIFKIQDEIAAAVVAALKLKLLPDHVALSAGNRPSNPEAHTQYLLGRQFFNRTNIDDFRRAVAAYKQAIALDPNYASAYAGLAVAENELSRDPENSLAEVLAGQQRALAAADRAIAIDPALSEGYAARGFLVGAVRIVERIGTRIVGRAERLRRREHPRPDHRAARDELAHGEIHVVAGVQIANRRVVLGQPLHHGIELAGEHVDFVVAGGSQLFRERSCLDALHGVHQTGDARGDRFPVLAELGTEPQSPR